MTDREKAAQIVEEECSCGKTFWDAAVEKQMRLMKIVELVKKNQWGDASDMFDALELILKLAEGK